REAGVRRVAPFDRELARPALAVLAGRLAVLPLRRHAIALLFHRRGRLGNRRAETDHQTQTEQGKAEAELHGRISSLELQEGLGRDIDTFRSLQILGVARRMKGTAAVRPRRGTAT